MGYKDITVKDMKAMLEDLPDNMPIVFAAFDRDDVDRIHGLYYARTAGVVESEYSSPEAVLCLNTRRNYNDISEQLLYSGKSQVHCTKLLFPEKED